MKILLIEKMNKKILLLDSLGALLTAINLLVIPLFENYMGIPKDISLILVPLPILYSIFSFLSYRFGNQNWRALLKMISLNGEGSRAYCLSQRWIVVHNCCEWKYFTYDT